MDEAESVRRQLNRGREIVRSNKMVEDTGVGLKAELRSTDTSEDAARYRYKIFKDEVYASLQTVREKFDVSWATPCPRLVLHIHILAQRMRTDRELYLCGCSRSSLSCSSTSYPRTGPKRVGRAAFYIDLSMGVAISAKDGLIILLLLSIPPRLPPAEVHERILKEFAYQSSHDLAEETFDFVRDVVSASSLIKQARANLVTRLNRHAADHPALLRDVVTLINDTFLHILKQQALAGHAVIRTSNPLLQSKTAIGMLLVGVGGGAINVGCAWKRMLAWSLYLT